MVAAARFRRVTVFAEVELDVVAAAPADILLAGALLVEELTDLLAFPRGMTTETSELGLNCANVNLIYYPKMFCIIYVNNM